MGGLLTYGIPNMKLSKATVERRVKVMEEEGITFLTNQEVGADAAEAAPAAAKPWAPPSVTPGRCLR